MLHSDGALNMDVSEFRKNLVPYPRIRLMLSSLATVTSAKKVYHEQLRVAEIKSAGSELASMMAAKQLPQELRRRNGKHMAA